MHALRDEAVSRLGVALVERGWQWWDEADHETPSFVLNRSNDLVNSIGLVSHEISGNQVAFSPTLGVTHLEVSRLAATFSGRPWRGAGDSSSFGTSLSSLLHSAGVPGSPYSRWLIEAQSEMERTVDVILADIEVYGMAFWDGFHDLGDMISCMQADKGYQALVGNLAIALALTGANEEAIGALEEYSAFTALQTGRMRDRTRSFVMSFSAHFGFGAEVGVV